MRKSILIILLLVGVCCYNGVGRAAQENDNTTSIDTAKSLDELLRVIKAERTRASRINLQREQVFLGKKESRQAILEKTKEQLKRKDKETIRLTNQMEENKKAIKNLQRELEKQAGDLNMFHSVLRQYAGDLKALLRTSLTSAQCASPLDTLERVSESEKIPSIEDIEKLWIAFQQEMTESGRIVRFRAHVITPQGASVEKSVTRLGVFTAIADGVFLEYSPETGGLLQLPRQPGGRILKYVADYETAKDSMMPMMIDPTKGQILSLISQKPTLFERIEQGGLVGGAIIVIGCVGVLIAAYRLLFLFWTDKKIQRQLDDLKNLRHNNPLGRVLSVFRGGVEADMEALELSLDEAILKEIPRLEWGQAIIKLLSVIAPLLGLLGTVIGMIVTFQAITLFGTGDPKLMADGISQALITTALGLVVAVPLLLCHGLVVSKAKGIIQLLDQQCAGLMAGWVEEKKSHGHDSAIS